MSVQTAPPQTARLLEATLDVLWRQWRAIGGAAAGGEATAQVDPEALCLASLGFERHEPRLWVVMADWLRFGSPLLSVQRLKNVAAQFPNTRQGLGRLAHVAVLDAKDLRWRSLETRERHVAEHPARPGKHRTAGPALQSPPALLLRLRAAFGVGVKADLLAYLLGQPLRVSVAEAAASLGYRKPTIFRAFQDLAAAGFVRSADMAAAVEYWVDSAQWHDLLGGPGAAARWGFWREILSYICAVFDWEERVPGRTISEYVRGVELREIGARHAPDLARAGLLASGHDLPSSPDLKDWAGFHGELAERMTARA